jgi:hypothetical protein
MISTSQAAQSSSSIQDQQQAKLESTVMNQNLTLEKRVKALKSLLKDEMVEGHIQRTLCVWDPLGKAGPITAAADDQVLRSLHYGMALTIETFQNENELIRRFLSENSCDAILISGAAALQFNRFMGTIDAIGAYPELKHLQLLAQVLAKPEMAPRLENEKFTVLGLATFGSTNLYLESSKLAPLSSIKNKSIAVNRHDMGAIEFIKAMGAIPKESGLMNAVQAFVEHESPILISPIIGYLVLGSGQFDKNVVANKLPLAQSSLQLIGHSKRFPAGLAQLLREDFLFKFNNYAKRVDKELSHIPANFWVNFSEKDKATIDESSQGVRITLRDEGYYDATMLRLARKIRCRFEPTHTECTNPIE